MGLLDNLLGGASAKALPREVRPIRWCWRCSPCSLPARCRASRRRTRRARAGRDYFRSARRTAGRTFGRRQCGCGQQSARRPVGRPAWRWQRGWRRAHGWAAGGGLGSLLNQFQQNGQGSLIDSWIGKGENQQVSPQQLGAVLDPAVINQLSEQSGLDRDELLSQLSQGMPDLINQITPRGHIQTEDEFEGQSELSRLSQQLR